MFPDTLAGVPLHDAAELHVLEAELADEDLGQGGVLLGVGGLVPHHHLVTTHLHQLRPCRDQCEEQTQGQNLLLPFTSGRPFNSCSISTEALAWASRNRLRS